MVQTRNGNSSTENADSGSPASQLKETLKVFMSTLQTQQKNFQLEMQQRQELFQQQMLQGQNGGTHNEGRNFQGRQDQNEIPQPIIDVTTIKNFLRLKPPTYSGGMDAVKSQEWINELEKNFRLLGCSERQKVEIGSYLLTGEANRWWNREGLNDAHMEWDHFVRIFKLKYMPRAMQNAKRLEFEKPKQGSNMLVADYEAEFTNLAEYVPHLLITKDMKARKFEEA